MQGRVPPKKKELANLAGEWASASQGPEFTHGCTARANWETGDLRNSRRAARQSLDNDAGRRRKLLRLRGRVVIKSHSKRGAQHERGSGVWPPPNSKENPDSQKSSPIKLLILKTKEKLRLRWPYTTTSLVLYYSFSFAPQVLCRVP